MTLRIHDQGYIVSKRRFSESKNLVSIFTQQHGRVDGIAPLYKKNPLDRGDHVSIKWSAKLPHQLGFMEVEGLKPIALALQCTSPSHAYTALLMIQSALALLEKTLILHHPYPILYNALQEFLSTLSITRYIAFERCFLKELGFGLSLDQCVVTGTTENLHYISPKSGCAVSQKAGIAYHNKLLPFPLLLRTEHPITLHDADVEKALQVLGYFIQKHLIEGDLPLPRQMLMGHLIGCKRAA